jgi:hypothetical protein
METQRSTPAPEPTLIPSENLHPSSLETLAPIPEVVLPTEQHVLPDDHLLTALAARFSTRFVSGTPLLTHMEHYLLLHADVCDLDFAEFTPEENLLPLQLLTDFSTRREASLSQLNVDLESRMVSLRTSLSLQQFQPSPPSYAPSPPSYAPSTSSNVNMYKRL